MRSWGMLTVVALGSATVLAAPNRRAVPNNAPRVCAEVVSVEGEAPSLLPRTGKFTLVWNDEFNGSRLDETKWNYRTNFWGRRAVWYAMPEDGCVEVGGGTAKLKVKRLANGQYVSPQLQTGGILWDDVPFEGMTRFKPLVAAPRVPAKFEHRYGYYECRCRLQKKAGWWSAFWMQSETQGTTASPARAGIEHDIMESFNPGEILPACFHYNTGGPAYCNFNALRDYNWNFMNKGVGLKIDVEPFHVFGLLWERDGYTWFIDGHQVSPKLGKGGAKGHVEAVSRVPEFLLLTTECKNYRDRGCTGQANPALEEAVAANDAFEVDYVRVYDLEK